MTESKNSQAEGLYSYDSFEGKKKGNEFNFLWWASGAWQELLRKYPSEHVKYSGLGGVITATFVLAALSAGYAVYSVFENIGWTILFAVIWGIIIFNFDRFLVSTMRKYGVSKRRQFWLAVPRIVLAVLIGVTISRPLELKIFEKEINTRVIQNLHTKMLRNDSLLQLEVRSLLQSAATEKDRLLARRGALEDTIHSLRSAYLGEADGTGGSGKRGIEKITQLKLTAYDNAVRASAGERVLIEAGIRQQDSVLISSRAELEKKRQAYESAAFANVGFLEKNKALSDLSDDESSVFMTSLMIALLIILIETGPVISKLLMQAGPYDVALAEEELRRMAASENEMRNDWKKYHDREERL